jgi:crotonobetaine/carnitine-CoA ligase
MAGEVMAANREDSREIVNPFASRDVNWLLDFRAETRADHPFLIWEPFEGQRAVWTYRQFRDRVLRVSAGLTRRGICPGDYVLVHLDNSPEMEFLWFACSRIGAVAVTTNTRSAGRSWPTLPTTATQWRPSLSPSVPSWSYAMPNA